MHVEDGKLQAAGSLRRLRWLILMLLFASTVINYVDRQALAVLLPTLRQVFHFTSSQYGTVSTAFLLAYTVGQIPAGMWLDRVGTRMGFSVFVALWSAAAVLQAFATGVFSFAGMRAMLGLSEAGNWPAGAKAVASWFPEERRAMAMAFFDGGSAIGAVVAPPVVALLTLRFGWRTAFVATGLMGFVWVAAWLVVTRSPARLKSLSEDAYSSVGNAASSHGLSVVQAMRRLAGQRALWGLMATRLLATPIWWFYVFWLPDYLSRGRGFSLRQIGLYAWIPFLTVDLGKFAGGSASDAMLRRGLRASMARKSVMLCGAACMMSGLMIIGASNARLAMVWACLATFGFGLWSANILALHADLFSARWMGSAVGMTGTAASLGGAVFTYAVGIVVDRRGYASAFWMTGVLAFVACFALVLGIGEVNRVELDPGMGVE